MPTLVRKTLREYRRTLIGWTIGLSGFVGLYLSVFTSISKNPDFYQQAALSKYPGALKDLMGGLADITSGAGYLQTVVYQLIGPLLFIMCAAILGNRAIAQPEESGTLELTMTLPLDRKRLVLERFAALFLSLLAIALVLLVLIVVVGNGVEMNVPFDRVAAAHTGFFLTALFFGTVSLAVGAATGSKATAMAVTGVWAVGGYVVVSIGKNVDAISWLKWISPFHYYQDARPLFTGFPVGDYLVLVLATVVVLLTSVLAFDRRDVGV
jgi:ABC-2 type transport system permease protein